MNELVTCTIDDGLCRITLNRPDKLNALAAASFQEIGAHLDLIAGEDVGCIPLSGAGRSFCAGHDLDDISSGVERAEVSRIETGVVERLANLPIPVVAAVQGHCLTGGLELVLVADIIIAAEGAKFADTHAKWDLVPIWGLSQRLPRRVGLAKAYEMMFASRTYSGTYSGTEAAAMGLANFCVPDGRLVEEADRFCQDTLANSWRALSSMKRLVQQTDGMPLAAGIAWELHHTAGRGPEMNDRLERMRKR